MRSCLGFLIIYSGFLSCQCWLLLRYPIFLGKPSYWWRKPVSWWWRAVILKTNSILTSEVREVIQHAVCVLTQGGSSFQATGWVWVLPAHILAPSLLSQSAMDCARTARSKQQQQCQCRCCWLFKVTINWQFPGTFRETKLTSDSNVSIKLGQEEKSRHPTARSKITAQKWGPKSIGEFNTLTVQLQVKLTLTDSDSALGRRDEF